MICAAQYGADDQWYRVKVVKLPGRRLVEVHYVDFGNEEIVYHLRLKKLLDRFLVLPVQVSNF